MSDRRHYTRPLLVYLITLLFSATSYGQCLTAIASYPYLENFELSDGGWVPGGVGNDWVWGKPTKSVIDAAAEGEKAWVVGGLAGNKYADGASSWLQSPCFDFSTLENPYLNFSIVWEMEYQFDGAGLQYSLDGGANWTTLGSANEPVNCLTRNWYNHSNITYLSPLSSNRNGWSGNIQSGTGSCRGGNGSNGWVVVERLVPELAGESSVIFRFVFGSGTICNNYNGFAVDRFGISEAPPNAAAFSYECENNMVDFTNESAQCPAVFQWNFGDPATGAANQSSEENPQHLFSGPGTYTVSLKVSGPGNIPASTTTRQVTILSLETEILQFTDCMSGSGGSAEVRVTGGSGPYQYGWNTVPAQTGPVATNLGPFPYEVSVSAPDACTTKAPVVIPADPSCTDVYFPSAFTPNQNGLNEGFRPLGNLGNISEYHLRIFDRWGQIVFDSKDPFAKWDGTLRGIKLDGNVFAWMAEFKLNGVYSRRKGSLMLIR